MDAKRKKTLRPRLDRRNAVKNIDYDPSSSPSSSSFDPQSPKLRTRSLEVDSKTSFQINGNDGEFDLICRSLGFSGPEDFAIPTSVWEAAKGRLSSEFAPGLHDHRDDFDKPDVLADQFAAQVVIGGNFKREIEDSELSNSSNFAEFDVNRSHAEFKSKSGSKLVELESRVGNGSEAAQFELEIPLNLVSLSATMAGGGGVRGERPPGLAPPPGLLQPVIDNVSSTWDILRSFAPEEDEDFNSRLLAEDASSSDEEERKVEENEDGDDINGEIEELNEVMVKENDVLSEPCSTSNSGGGDGPGVVMESLYIISPNGKFWRSIMSWQKGELLGSGSFGTVYEGYTK